MNKKFAIIFLITIIITFFILSNMDIIITDSTEKTTYYGMKQVYEDDTYRINEAKDIESLKSRVMTSEEIEQILGKDLIDKIVDLIIKYKINNKGDNEKTEYFSREEIREEILNLCIVEETEKYGEIINLQGNNQYYINLTTDGKNINFNKYFNYTIEEEEYLQLNDERIEEIIQLGKTFLGEYLPEAGQVFEPDNCRIDMSGYVYVMEDSKNGITFEYNLMYKCPCAFYIGF